MASLMNGFSALGAGVAQFAGTAGLEQQRAQLANQSAVLADQLATTRESVGRVQAGDIAAAAAEKQQQFQTGLEGQRQTFQAGENAKTQAAEMARTQATEAGATARTKMTIDAPPETIKLLRALGVQLPGDAPPAATSTSTAPGSTGGTSSPSTSAPGVAPDTSAAEKPDLMENPLVRKALGFPAAGSAEASRYAISKDVDSDPAFRYKTAGQKAAETELRVAVAEGKMTDPGSREAMAQGIASYQIAPLSGFSLTKPGGPETMARAIQLNPDYQESRYPEINKGMSAFGTGKQGDLVRANNVGVQHLDVIDQAGEALGNGDVKLLNSLKNTFQQQIGVPEPTTFDGLKHIVGTEIQKAISGGIGSSDDRDRLMKALDGANSPAQLRAITDGFRSLMVGQLAGLKTQYEEATGFKSGPFAFENKLAPETAKRLMPHSGGATPSAKPEAASSPAVDPIAMARDAISRGAPRDAVMQRLKQNGIDPGALDGGAKLPNAPMIGQD
jgi:hypothetical protein